MIPITELLQQGAANAWILAPSAILLGALHGLEPGHSKTMMAAFIVAVKGTVRQAVLLGLAATFSHTLVVWAVALSGIYFWKDIDSEATEPYFEAVSGLLIISVAAWIVWRARNEAREAQHACCSHDHSHKHAHDHNHTHSHAHDHTHPHDTPADVTEDILDVASEGYQTAHERAHAEEIRRRFTHREVTTGQIVLFGLTGGLIPCPAAITVLLLCLQLKKASLGLALVLCFSVGLALVMVAAGVVAAIGAKHIGKRWGNGLGKLAQHAPYFSGALITIIGGYITYQGVAQILSR